MQQAVNVVEEVFFGQRGPFASAGIRGLEMGETRVADANAATPKRGANYKPYDAFKSSYHLDCCMVLRLNHRKSDEPSGKTKESDSSGAALDYSPLIPLK